MERTFGMTSIGKVSYLYRPGTVNLVFLHGLGGSSNNWMKLSGFLDDRFSLYFLDLLGHGRTESESWDYTVDGQCRMLEEFLNDLGLENYGLIGNSYGGWISATYAAKFSSPDYLILEDSAGTNPTVGEMDDSRIQEFIDRLQSFGRPNNRETMERIIRQNSRGEEKLTPSLLKGITSGTMVVWGEHDRIIDISYGKKMSDMIPGSEFRIIEGAGHIPHYTHAEQFSSLINEFILAKGV